MIQAHGAAQSFPNTYVITGNSKTARNKAVPKTIVYSPRKKQTNKQKPLNS